MSFFFSFLSFSVFLQLERERGVYIIGYKEKQSQSLLILFRWIPVGNVSSFTADRLYLIFSSGLRAWLLRVRDIFCLLLPGVLGFSSVRPESCPTNFLFSFFRWREEGATSVLGSQPITWLLSSSPLASATICHPVSHSFFPSGHQVQTSVFPFWLGFVNLGLTHILSCLNGHSLMHCQFKHGEY